MVYFASYFALVFALGAFIGFAFGYFYRGGVNKRRAAKANAQASSAEASSAASSPATSASDELLGLPGMVPATAAALAGAGVSTLDDLRGLAGDRLAEVAGALKLEDFALRRWVGLADLSSLPAVDGDMAQALVRVGVRNATDLAGENADRVQNKLNALNDAEGIPASVPSRSDVAAMIEAASAR